MTGDALVVFTPSGRRGRFEIGTPILQAARSLGVDIDSVCGGRGLCGRCQIEPSIGQFAKHGVHTKAEHLSDLSDTERAFEREYGPLGKRRLSCSTAILGDLVIDVPPESQVHRQVVRKRAEVDNIELNPIVRLYYVDVQQPNMHDPAGDLRRVMDALEFEWRLTDLFADIRVIQELQRALRDGDWCVTVAVHNANKIIAVWPGYHNSIFGMAVDVGSTTIAAHLADLRSGKMVASTGMMNPQIRYGEDLMSRVSYVMLNPGGDLEMTRAVRDALNELAFQLTQEAGIGITDIIEATFVANPIMHHLLMGISPIELGGAPFALATDEAISSLWASEIDLEIHPNARIYVLPCIAGHVGADTAGVILSESPHHSERMELVVDVGTNAEIILGNRERLLACSSPTGPAFEGAQISGGQRAAPGAVERVRIDHNTLEPKFRVIGSDLWSDDANFVDSLPASGVSGICGSGIIEAIAELFLAGVIDRDGVIDGHAQERSSRIVANGRTFAYQLFNQQIDIRITQNDVRAIQLAKAALYAGIRLLMDRMGVEQVDRIRLAGAFGSHIDVKYAMVLGMIPDCPLDQVSSSGNAAGTGALIALLDSEARAEIEQVVRSVEKIETAVEPRFQAHFVEAMAFPHASAAYPNLQKAIELPAFKERQAPRRGRRRSRG